MATTITAVPAFDTRSRTQLGFAMWPLFAVLGSSAAIVIGLVWDISWHRTVGRDSFWTLAHVLEQVAAIVTGLSCGWLVLHTTFAGTQEARDRSVRFWGFQGPLGAWVCIWGTLMMITSAPFDNWWHNAYGLDVKIISPPHSILALGMMAIQVGALMMIGAVQNRSTDRDESRRLSVMFAFAAGVLLCMMAVIVTEYAALGNDMHSGIFYKVSALAFPMLLVAYARGSRLRWPGTAAAGVYMGILIGMILVLQLFPATPMLAPIYNPVTRMVPPPFPLLLIIPALAIDLVVRRFGAGRDWRLSALLGVVFVAVMLAVHWPWGEFMISPASRNYFFAGDQWSYDQRLGDWRYEFWNLDRDASGRFSPVMFGRNLLIASFFGFASSRIGLWIGNGISRVRR